jgi:hypothetical protein
VRRVYDKEFGQSVESFAGRIDDFKVDMPDEPEPGGVGGVADDGAVGEQAKPNKFFPKADVGAALDLPKFRSRLRFGEFFWA